jgi:hypothetical protein
LNEATEDLTPTLAPMEPGRRAHWLRRPFFALALLYLIPFWVVRHVPTVDGPCHTYDAWILRQHADVQRYPLFQQYYEINRKPYPNWISQGGMALLMLAAPPAVAEKLFVSGYVLLFLAGAWYLVGSVRPGERWLAFLAFPFAYHQLFQYGFYNFSVSVALFLFALGLWWRRRERPDLAFAVAINLLLWLCYFSHILSFGLALLAIAILWLATLRRQSWRRHLWHIPVLLPQVALPAWFFARQGGDTAPSAWSAGQLVRFFAGLRVLFTLGDAQLWLGAALAVLFLFLLVLSLRRVEARREENAFLLVALLFAVLYFVSPDAMAGGWLLKNRLSLYPFLVLLPWLSPRLGRRAERIGTATLALVALANLVYLTRGYRELGAEVERYLSGLAPVTPDTRILALLFAHTGPTDVLSHAPAYMAIEKGLIDWDNFEAKTSFFPVRFRASVPLPVTPDIQLDPDSYRVLRNAGQVDAVYVWGRPPGDDLAERLKRCYKLVSEEDIGELYERREPGGCGDEKQGRSG